MKITASTTIEELGAIVCQTLEDHGIHAFLSGGAVVSIYTQNKHESFDLDFVTFEDRKNIKKVMEALGFSQDKSRLYIHPHSKYFVEFPGSSLAIGDQRISKFSKRNVAGMTLRLLTPTDCIKDRLASFIHWKDLQALDQAVLVGRAQKFKVSEIERFCKLEGNSEAFSTFLKALKKAKRC